MTQGFVNRLVSNAMNSVAQTYSQPGQREKLEGSLAGLNACLNQKLEGLREVLAEINEYVHLAAKERWENYWWFRLYQAQVEFIINRVSGPSPFI